MFVLLLLSQNPNWWPTYGADLANTHFSPLKGAMSTAPSVVWQYSDVGYVERSPATAEIGDGDNYLETLVPGYTTGNLALLEGATQTVQWTYSSSAANAISTAAMYDVDNDPQLECIATYNGGSAEGIVCLDGLSGAAQWTSTRGKTRGSAKVAELVPSNPGLEVVISDTNGILCLDAATGTQLWFAQLGLSSSTPALADVDGDGRLEVGVACYDTAAVLEGENGQVKWKHPISNQYSSPTLFDVTGDGVPDLVLASDMEVRCYDGNTGALHWTVSTTYSVEAGIAAWDLDNDDTVEVLIGCRNSTNTAGVFYCVNGRTGNVEWNYSTDYGVHRAVSLVDVNSDNQVEILLPGCKNGGANTLKCLRPDGSLLWEVSLSTAHDIHDPSNSDYDNDGCAELIVGTYGVNSAWFLDDPNDSSGCGVLSGSERDMEIGMGYGEPEITTSGNDLLLILPRDTKGELSIYDMAGRQVMSLFSGMMRKGEYRFHLSVESAGLYVAAFTTEQGTVSSTLEIVR